MTDGRWKWMTDDINPISKPVYPVNDPKILGMLDKIGFNSAGWPHKILMNFKTEGAESNTAGWGNLVGPAAWIQGPSFFDQFKNQWGKAALEFKIDGKFVYIGDRKKEGLPVPSHIEDELHLSDYPWRYADNTEIMLFTTGFSGWPPPPEFQPMTFNTAEGIYHNKWCGVPSNFHSWGTISTGWQVGKKFVILQYDQDFDGTDYNFAFCEMLVEP